MILWLCSDAEIPLSSASSQDRKSRADIAAAFQVDSLCFLHWCFSLSLSLSLCGVTVGMVYSFISWCTWGKFHAASRSVTFGGKMWTSYWMGIEDRAINQIFCKYSVIGLQLLWLVTQLYAFDFYQKVFSRLSQVVLHQINMWEQDLIKLPRTKASSLFAHHPAFVLTMVTLSFAI